MTCEHIAKLNKFVREQGIDISSMELIRIVCRSCQLKHECPSLPVEYFENPR